MWPLKSNTWRGCQLSCGLTSFLELVKSSDAGLDRFRTETQVLQQLQLRAGGIKGKPVLIVPGDGFLIGGFYRFGRTVQHFQIAQSGF